MTALIPEGLEPLAVWDSVSEYGFAAVTVARGEWARRHLGDPAFIYRVEIYLLDSPFAVVHSYARNANGYKYHDPDEDGPAKLEPVVVPLDELPPAHLLKA